MLSRACSSNPVRDGRSGVFYWDADSSGTLGMFGAGNVAQPSIDPYQIGTTPTATAAP